MAASKNAKKKRSKIQKKQNAAKLANSNVISPFSSPERSPTPISPTNTAKLGEETPPKLLDIVPDLQIGSTQNSSLDQSPNTAANAQFSDAEFTAEPVDASETRSETSTKQLLPAFQVDSPIKKESSPVDMVATESLVDSQPEEHENHHHSGVQLDEDVDEEDLEAEIVPVAQPAIPQRSVARSVEAENAVMLEATRQQVLFAKPVMLNEVVASADSAPDEDKHRLAQVRQNSDDDFDPDLYFSGSDDEIVTNAQDNLGQISPQNDDSSAFDKGIDIDRIVEPTHGVETPKSDKIEFSGYAAESLREHENGQRIESKIDVKKQDDQSKTSTDVGELDFTFQEAAPRSRTEQETRDAEEARHQPGMIRKVNKDYTPLPSPVSSPRASTPIAASHHASRPSLDESPEHSPKHHTAWTKSRDIAMWTSGSAPSLDPVPHSIAPPSIVASHATSLSSPHASPRPYKYAQSPLPDTASARPEPPIFGVGVVGFHHKRGPEVEYWVGPEESESNMWPYLPFQSLPDGSHQFEENICYFTLLYDRKRSASISLTFSRDEEGHIHEGTSDFRNVTTLFAIACSKQMPVEDLKHVSEEEEYTRSVVQKSVVVIASKPIFGPIKEKLAVVTRSYFSQCDFSDRAIIDHFYANLVQMPMWANENDLQVGMNLQRCVHDFGSQVLIILKAMLLERKILFYSSDTDELGATQFALISLVPNLISNLEDSGSPLLSTYEVNLQSPQSFQSSDRASLLRYAGLPLQLFAAGGVFAPFVPLQQFEDLKQPETRYGLFGTANNLFLGGDIDFDVVVNVDQHDIQIRNVEIAPLLKLTDADRAFAKDVTAKVNSAWDSEDTWQPQVLGYYGGEDYIRHEYEEYLLGLLGCAKYVKSLLNSESSESNSGSARSLGLDEKEAVSAMQPWGKAWIEKWMLSTNNFRIFDKHTDSGLYHTIGMAHPGQKLLKPSGFERFFGFFKPKPPIAQRQQKSEDETPNSSAPQTPSLKDEGFDLKSPMTPHELLRLREEERSAERRGTPSQKTT